MGAVNTNWTRSTQGTTTNHTPLHFQMALNGRRRLAAIPAIRRIGCVRWRLMVALIFLAMNQELSGTWQRFKKGNPQMLSFRQR